MVFGSYAKNKKPRLSNYNFNDVDEECFIYIVECLDRTLYTGMTHDLVKRIGEHNDGNGANYTKKHGFKKLVYFERCLDRKQAFKREREIKDKGTKYRWLMTRKFKEYVDLLKKK